MDGDAEAMAAAHGPLGSERSKPADDANAEVTADTEHLTSRSSLREKHSREQDDEQEKIVCSDVDDIDQDSSDADADDDDGEEDENNVTAASDFRSRVGSAEDGELVVPPHKGSSVDDPLSERENQTTDAENYFDMEDYDDDVIADDNPEHAVVAQTGLLGDLRPEIDLYNQMPLSSSLQSTRPTTLNVHGEEHSDEKPQSQQPAHKCLQSASASLATMAPAPAYVLQPAGVQTSAAEPPALAVAQRRDGEAQTVRLSSVDASSAISPMAMRSVCIDVGTNVSPAPARQSVLTQATTSVAADRSHLESQHVAVAIAETPQTASGNKLIDAVAAIKAELAGLSVADVSEGFVALGRHYRGLASKSASGFSNHALDVAIVTVHPPQGQPVSQALRQTVKWQALSELPLAAAYAFVALVFMALFVSVHFPSKYLPIAMDSAKKKLVEWQVKEKAALVLESARSGVASAYQHAVESTYHAKAVEYVDAARRHASVAYDSAAASAAAQRAAELGARVRGKIGEQLRALRAHGDGADGGDGGGGGQGRAEAGAAAGDDAAAVHAAAERV